jgi:hypothetical protein
MVFKPGKSGNANGRPKGKRTARSRKYTDEALEWFRKVRDGSAKNIPWAIRYKCNELLLAYAEGLPPRAPQALQHSGPGGQPLNPAFSGKVYIYDSLEAAQLAASSEDGSEERAAVFLPSNRYEVDLSRPPQEMDEEPELEPPPPRAEISPPAGKFDAEPSLEQMSEEALLRLACERGLEKSRDTSVAEPTCTCNGTSNGRITCAVHGRFR